MTEMQSNSNVVDTFNKSETEASGPESKDLQVATQDKHSKENECMFRTPDRTSYKSLDRSLEELAVLWKQRNITPASPSASAIHDAFRDDLPDMPSIDYTSSIDSDERRDNAPNSPRGHVLKFFGSPRCVSEPVQALERMVEERDLKIETLESLIISDTDIMKKMKSTVDKMVKERNEAQSASSMRTIVAELESTIDMQEKQNETLKEECLRLRDKVKGLEESNTSNENIIKSMKDEMDKLLLTQDELGLKLADRNEALANLETSFMDNATKSKRMIATLEVRGSSLEDKIKDLEAEILRLQVSNQLLEVEKMTEKAMNTETELFHIDHCRYEV